MINHAGKIAPAIVAPNLDHPRPYIDAENQPPQKPEDGSGRRRPRKGARVQQGTKENREKTRLQQLALPAEPVPGLADVNEGHIENPEDQKHRRVGESDEHKERKNRPGPGACHHHAV